MAEDLHKEFEALKADVARLRGDISDLAGAVRHAGEESGRQAYAKARQAGEQAWHQASEAEQAAAHEIAERPVASVLTAFGVGFLVGLILDRRR
ncbi:MAG TPA: hypothetical protein VFA95_11270 [Gammaproteobacteria bacterium]|nr:hypothetical protein [Gammaproteobacteria bacterium]